jgi:hypothetical protein
MNENPPNKHYFSNFRNQEMVGNYMFNPMNTSFKSEFDFNDFGYNRPSQQPAPNNYGSNIDFKFSSTNPGASFQRINPQASFNNPFVDQNRNNGQAIDPNYYKNIQKYYKH